MSEFTTHNFEADTIEQRLERLENKVDSLVEFANTINDAASAAMDNPMLKSVLGSYGISNGK